jgi:predicted nucleic acid-binding protein
LKELYGEIIARQVYDEVAIAGAGLPGADEVQGASWIRLESSAPESSLAVEAACAGLGSGERSIIYLAMARGARALLNESLARLGIAKLKG